MQSRSKGVEHDIYGRTGGQIQLRSLRRIGKDLAKLTLIFVFERETIKCHCLVFTIQYLPSSTSLMILVLVSFELTIEKN